MDEQLLSQEEINLLLKTLGKEEDKKEAKTVREAQPFNVSSLEHIYAGRLPGLELVFEKWISGLKRGLVSVIVSMPTIIKEGVSSIRFGELVSRLPFPSALGYFNLQPFKGNFMIILDPKLIYMVVSNVFGGSTKPYKIEGKEFTKVEMRIIERMLKVLYTELEEAWRAVMNVQIVPLGIEINPALLMFARPREKYIVLRLTVSLEGGEGYILLAIPQGGIEPYREMLKGVLERKPEDYERLLKAILKVPLRLSVKLGNAKVTLKELYDLKVGDTIVLAKPTKEPVEVYIEGIKKFLGILGHSKDKKAFKILSSLQE